MEKVRYHFFVSGLVQGVFFRAETRAKAIQHGVTGWVKNLADSRVEVMAEGEKEEVEKLVEFCQDGPPGAKVIRVELKEEKHLGKFDKFVIKYSSYHP
ncbi:acylphosphatase [bacterium]|nr:acylphosphatase [bacterium]MBU0899995.1 acylphosphatase [bacterium]MBU1153461.1 acylphosphatase [bacterium]MBU1782822.1 acylphosphatase [bacterium]MBU2599334.1 acylphosphatase [bacterium]